MFLMSMLLFSFVASAQTTIVVHLDSKDRAYVEINGSEVPNLVDGDNTIELPNMHWTNGYLDANRIAEVTILTRVNP